MRDRSRQTRIIAAVLLAGTLLASAGAAPAQQADSHAAHAPMPASAESTAAFQAANRKMHAAMEISYTGVADVDFARGMIAHHQGAIDMSRVELAHGTDPALRRLAEEVIRAQEAEIAFLEQWLAEHAE
jgi:uncharacterized protein (DUF305 family)